LDHSTVGLKVDKKVEWTVVLSVDMRVLRKVEKRAAMKDGQMVECWELNLVELMVVRMVVKKAASSDHSRVAS